MVTLRVTSTASERRLRRARPPAQMVVLFPASIAGAALTATATFAFIGGLGDDRRSTIALGMTALVAGLASWRLDRTVTRPNQPSAASMLLMTTVTWLIFIAGAAVVHAAAGATNAVDVAIFEATATATTTAMTTLDPGELSRGILLFRAAGQWTAGFGALMVALVVIPFASKSRELSRAQGTRSLNPAQAKGFGRIGRIYLGSSAVIFVGYLAAGMGLFDAVAHAMTTVSTGGLSTQSTSLGAYGSPAIEWVAGAGMAVAGLNLIAVWWILRGDIASVRRGIELRTYAGVMVFATGALTIWFGDTLGLNNGIRTAFFTVASAMSTTGFVTVPWGVFDTGAQALLFVLVGVGAMAGSAGGGFRYLRVLEALRFASRELSRQLHPRSVHAIKVGGRVISERSIDRLHGYTMMFVLAAAFGAIAVASADGTLGPTAALSMSLSALVTAGPTIGEPGSPTFAELGAMSHISLSVLMLLGRLSIYPVLLSAGTAVGKAGSAVREWRAHRLDDR